MYVTTSLESLLSHELELRCVSLKVNVRLYILSINAIVCRSIIMSVFHFCHQTNYTVGSSG